jgi:hypothetical protein
VWSSKSLGSDKPWSVASAALHSGHYVDAIIRSEGNRLKEEVQESIDIAQASGTPADIYYFKRAGRFNQPTPGEIVAMTDASRARACAVKGPEHAAIDLVIEDGTRVGPHIS